MVIKDTELDDRGEGSENYCVRGGPERNNGRFKMLTEQNKIITLKNNKQYPYRALILLTALITISAMLAGCGDSGANNAAENAEVIATDY